MSDDVYPDAGARELLRDVTQYVVQDGGEQSDRDARVAAAETLLDAVANLFCSYSVEVTRPQRTPPSPTRVWTVRRGGRNPSLCLHADDEDGVRGYLALHSQRLESTFACALIWDRASQRWLGASLGVRDFDTPGYPLRRVSALETLTASILAALGMGRSP